MEDFINNGFLEDISDSCSSFYDEKVSTTVSPLESEDVNLDWLNPESELGVDIYLKDELWHSESSRPVYDFSTNDHTLSLLCSVCHKNIVKAEDTTSQIRKKRKRQENVPIFASMTVCEDCRNLNVEDLKNLKNASDKSKRVIKREHAKRRVMESEAVKKLKEEQQQLAEDSKDMPESERKRLQQMIRNRISAQQSRDRKKAFVTQIEDENQSLRDQNNNLKYKLKQIQDENTYLKNQLTQIHMGSYEQPFLSKAAKGASLALATVISVMMVVNSLNADQDSSMLATPRQLIEKLDLNDFKNPDGVSLSDVSNQAFKEIGINIDQFFSVESSEPPRNDLLEIRQNRIDKVYNQPNLRALAGPIDPCTRSLNREIQDGAMTTLFCPTVQAYWDESQGEPNLQVLQLVLPLESLPGLVSTPLDTSNKHLLELVCKVSDVNVLPIS